MPSFYIPLSGLNADTTALNTIANNLSNMNTTGFKSQKTNFSDLFYQEVGTTGSGDEIQVGTGVQVASNSTDFTGGAVSTTGVATDAAIDGTGFFVLDAGNGSQLYTRNGSFQTSAAGTLESTNGQAVMGYMALNGVINTGAGLSDITIPTGQVMQPSATTSFSLTQNLDSTSAAGTQATGQVEVHDSLGKAYEATVTYTNLGGNKWSYAITVPDTLSAAAATAAAAATMPLTATLPAAATVTAATAAVEPAATVPSPVTASSVVPQNPSGKQTNFTFGSYTDPTSGATTQATVDTSTSLVITAPNTTGVSTPVTITPTKAAGESVAQYVIDINNALAASNIANVTASSVKGVLSLAGPSTMTVGGYVNQDILGTTVSSSVTPTSPVTASETVTLPAATQAPATYNFVTSNGTLATVAPSTTLAISEGGGQSVSVPAFSASQSVVAYAQNFQAALTSAGITDVTVAAANGKLSITGPANMAITGVMQQTFAGAQSSFNFGSYTDPNTGLTAQAAVAPTTSLTITGPTTAGGSTTITVTPSNPAGESIAQYAADVQSALTAAKITGVTISAANGTLSINGPDTATIAGTMNQDMLGTTSNYAFETGATVDPTTNLRITGQTSTGATATIVAPSVSTGETVAQYATALSSALSTAGIADVTVTSSNGQLSIAGANISTTGSIKQGLADSTISYDFGSTATVNPATNLTIVGPTVSGTPLTAITAAPAVTAGETVAQYAADLTKALKNAGINTGPDGVSVTATGGQLTIVGPAATLKTAGIASQDLSATTVSYNFGTSGGTIATVDPKTNLTITGQTASGATATTLAPKVTLGETLAQYVNALNDSLTTAGVAGVTVSSTAGGILSITGANTSTAGSVIQDPVASTNGNGTLTFDSSGNLVNPSANLPNITFAGLSDAAAPMNMTWDLFGATGAGGISQTAVAAGQAASGQTGQNANGYAAGNYQDFTIGSDGTITAKYSNGQNQTVGQIGLAKVSNLQGLADVGSSQYRTTTASGPATVGLAGAGGLGTLEGSSLEASNVNISQEFSNLIIAQRAFEANSKAVTTFDTVTQETINMIH